MQDWPRHDHRLLVAPADRPAEFTFIDPPFNANAPNVARYPVEVSGNELLNSMCRRLGWSSLVGRRLLDFGCGVRLARTIVNLGIELTEYAGVDVNEDAIAWMVEATRGSRLNFHHLDMANPLYRPSGADAVTTTELHRRGLQDFDAACMFSVITHQEPADAEHIFKMLHHCVKDFGQLYFTAFLDHNLADYAEAHPDSPCLMSIYHPDFLIDLLWRSGWRVEAIYPMVPFQQPALVCRKVSPA